MQRGKNVSVEVDFSSVINNTFIRHERQTYRNIQTNNKNKNTKKYINIT